jgi:hypothetical protein
MTWLQGGEIPEAAQRSFPVSGKWKFAATRGTL